MGHNEFIEMLLEAPSTYFADRFEWVVGRIDKDELRVFYTLMWAA